MEEIKKHEIIAFDLLRAIMLFLLIVFHAGVSFLETNVDGWFYFDNSKNILFDTALGYIHAFRHPVFFLISGFVTEQMYFRYSSKQVVSKRFKRLVLPLIFVVLIVVPIIFGLFALILNDPDGFTLKTMFPISEKSPLGITTNYVWFLYYLTLFNLVHLSLIHFNLTKYLDKIKLYIKLIALLFLVSFLLLLSGKDSLYGRYEFLPSLDSLGGYFLFYLFGISIVRQESDFTTVQNKSLWLILIGVLSINVYFFIKAKQFIDPSFFFQELATVSFTISTISLSFGAIGLAFKYYLKQNKYIKYISKSSYFLYLNHFPVLMFFLYIVAPLNYNAFIKFVLIFIPTIFISLILNHIWIRAWKGNAPI